MLQQILKLTVLDFAAPVYTVYWTQECWTVLNVTDVVTFRDDFLFNFIQGKMPIDPDFSDTLYIVDLCDITNLCFI